MAASVPPWRRRLARKNPAPCEFVGVQDRFGKSGEFEELLGYFNLDAAAIVEAVKGAGADFYGRRLSRGRLHFMKKGASPAGGAFRVFAQA